MEVSKIGTTLVLRLYAGIDLSSASPLAIEYTDPDGNTGSLDATAYGDNNDYAEATFPAATAVTKGVWLFEITGTISSAPYKSYETFRLRLKNRFN